MAASVPDSNSNPNSNPQNPTTLNDGDERNPVAHTDVSVSGHDYASARDRVALLARIQYLESALREANAELARLGRSATTPTIPSPVPELPPPDLSATLPSHLLLLLADSALPLGSFAFSSGLESYLYHLHPTVTTAHHHQSRLASGGTASPTALLRRFLSLSLTSLATTTLPFLVAAYQFASTTTPSAIFPPYLDDAFDSTTTCPVLRRSSTTQGKALLALFRKSLLPSLSPHSPPALQLPYSHYPIAYPLVCSFCSLTLHQTAHLFVLAHLKSLLSAAVRLNLIGPYVAQAMLAAHETQEAMQRAMQTGLEMGLKGGWEEAGQMVPTLDLYQGRHELLYSRVFNS
ncbi:hypothetical protein BDZ91DRAFT_434200 [Kalaharituber pfeilii]|nr:hypothetical protein BDZ91DRAFT_434200 [Kalaharituber pfeilii]